MVAQESTAQKDEESSFLSFPPARAEAEGGLRYKICTKTEHSTSKLLKRKYGSPAWDSNHDNYKLCGMCNIQILKRSRLPKGTRNTPIGTASVQGGGEPCVHNECCGLDLGATATDEANPPCPGVRRQAQDYSEFSPPPLHFQDRAASRMPAISICGLLWLLGSMLARTMRRSITRSGPDGLLNSARAIFSVYFHSEAIRITGQDPLPKLSRSHYW